MAVAFEIGVCDLIAEFLTHTFVVLRFLQTARAITALHVKAFLDLRHERLIFIESNCHTIPPFTPLLLHRKQQRAFLKIC